MENIYFLNKSFKNLLSFSFLGLISIATMHAQGCVDPVVSDTSGPGTICAGETATLAATHDGQTLNWYDAASGGNLLGSGSPFLTAPLNATTSFWAESVNGGTGTPVTGAARVAPASNSNASVVNVTSPWGLAFDVNEDITINSVDVFLASNTPGTIVMQLKDSGLNILDESTISVPAGNAGNPVQHTLTLDFFVPAGTDYNLVAESSPVMVREFSSEHPGFPYPLGSVGNVINGTINDNDTNSGLYYFFYNWTFTPGESCTSDRVEEIVNVNVTDIPLGDSNQTFNSGETLADLTVTGTNLRWYSDAAGANEIPDTTVLVDGTTYYVSATENACESELLAITVSEILNVIEQSLINLSYYPSPVTDQLKISNDEPILKIEVFTILGQRALIKQYDTKDIAIDLSSLMSGNYLVKVATQTGIRTFKVIKK